MTDELNANQYRILDEGKALGDKICELMTEVADRVCDNKEAEEVAFFGFLAAFAGTCGIFGAHNEDLSQQEIHELVALKFYTFLNDMPQKSPPSAH
jgi:hypothetical protein